MGDSEGKTPAGSPQARGASSPLRSAASSSLGTGNRDFATTHWSLIRSAGDADSAVARDALESLCAAYWYPLYSFVRRQGIQASSAADLTQGFFAQLIEKQDWNRIEESRGRFRSFLMTSIRNFLSNQRKKENAQKRGGKENLFSIDSAAAENRYAAEASSGRTAEAEFERNWVLSLLQLVKQKLKDDYQARGRESLFEKLEPYLIQTTGTDTPSYRMLAEELEINEAAVKVNVHRLRKSFAAKLRDEIANTVSHPDEIDDELKTLFQALQK